jgi:CDGSH-type Zn-finger protein/uncharacterized Fe-S cluster protein YjdI
MDEKIHTYEGDAISVRYDVKRCIHFAACVRGLPGVFDSDRRPWIVPNEASDREVAAVVAHCPTGALHAVPANERLAEPRPTTNRITVAADGPLYVRGDLELRDGNDRVVLRDTRMALCRCGASQNKPLCDGSHTKAGFRDPAALGTANLTPADDGHPLSIQASHNGPLLLQGPVTIRSADADAPPVQGTKTALCRCGGSANKPFCDGSHKRIGFTDT